MREHIFTGKTYFFRQGLHAINVRRQLSNLAGEFRRCETGRALSLFTWDTCCSLSKCSFQSMPGLADVAHYTIKHMWFSSAQQHLPTVFFDRLLCSKFDDNRFSRYGDRRARDITHRPPQVLTKHMKVSLLFRYTTYSTGILHMCNNVYANDPCNWYKNNGG